MSYLQVDDLFTVDLWTQNNPFEDEFSFDVLLQCSSFCNSVVYYLLIKEMTCFGHRNEFPMVSKLVCIVTHWKELM